MEIIKEYTYEIKKSKFIGIRYKVDNIDEVNIILNNIKREHKSSRHIPYAYRIGNTIKKSDDKEPANTAGTPIYNVIINNNLDNTLILIIRYFGGIKLGSGGLIRVYAKVARELVD